MMNYEDDDHGSDMSDEEYRRRIAREKESQEFYANVRKTWKPSNNDKSSYRFSSDDDDAYLSY
jgi:hypothetical protein